MIELKSKREIGLMQEAADILRKVFDSVMPVIEEGIRTEEIDEIAEKVILKSGAVAAFKGYRKFPKASCISINEEVVHGIPGKRKLREGDLVSFDIGVKYNGFFADAARTWSVGEARGRKKELIEVANGALNKALDSYKPDCYLGDLSEAIERYVEKHNFRVIRDYVGHGIGRSLHEDPQVPNFGKAGRGIKIQPGLVLAFEPMISDGHFAVETLSDGWTVVTKDGSVASHWEDTVAFLENGFINLTGGYSKELNL